MRSCEIEENDKRADVLIDFCYGCAFWMKGGASRSVGKTNGLPPLYLPYADGPCSDSAWPWTMHALAFCHASRKKRSPSFGRPHYRNRRANTARSLGSITVSHMVRSRCLDLWADKAIRPPGSFAAPSRPHGKQPLGAADIRNFCLAASGKLVQGQVLKDTRKTEF